MCDLRTDLARSYCSIYLNPIGINWTWFFHCTQIGQLEIGPGKSLLIVFAVSAGEGGERCHTCNQVQHVQVKYSSYFGHLHACRLFPVKEARRHGRDREQHAEEGYRTGAHG